MRRFSIAAATACFALLVFAVPAFAADSPPPMMAIPGKMGVSATGAFTYTLPIIVPPGTNNIVPALSLDYSSQYGDGTVGMGWTLAGLPTVTRCPRTLAQDGVHGGVNYNSDDRLCMNGQRLILVAGTGNYWDDGSQYRTEVDTFSEIILHIHTAGTNYRWFEVHSKNGQVLQFGNTPDSRLYAVGTGTTRTWAVNQIADTKGNYLTVTYENDATNGEAYPIEIDYTGNESAALVPYNSVKFTYEPRAANDIVPTYQAGSLMQTTVLLQEIDTYINTNTTPVLVSKYELAYQKTGTTNSVGHSASHDELISVSQCPGSGSCPTQFTTNFTWQGSGPAPAIDSSNNLGYGQWASSYGYPYLVPGDFNGDGITDLVVPQPIGQVEQGYCFYIGTGAGTPSSFNGETYNFCPGRDRTYPPAPPLSRTYLMGDFSGDGLTDFIQITAGAGAAWTPWISTGSGFTQGTTTAGSAPMAVGDFNGDGLADLLYMGSGTGWPSGEADIYFAKSTADGTFSSAVGWVGYGNFVTAADFDGDGCTDLMLAQSSTEVKIFYAYNSSNPSLQCNPAQTSADITGMNIDSTATTTLTGDFNGDGKADFIDTGGQLWLSTGTGLLKTNFVAPTSWGDGGQVGDFNGDGRQDVIVQNGSNIEIWASTGQTGCLPGPSCADGSHPAFTKIHSVAPSGTVVWLTAADWNNDGAADALIQTATGAYAPLLLTEYTPELMTEVTDGLGANVVAQYKNLSTGGSSFYTKGTSAVYPTQDMDGPQYFVSETLTSNGINGTYETDYSYAGAQTDLHGRGFLGFATVTATDKESGLITATTYSTQFPTTGMVEEQVKTCPLSTCTSEAITLGDVNNCQNLPKPCFDVVNEGGTPGSGAAYYFVGMTQSVIVSNDLDGSAFPTTTTNYTYDCDGTLPCYGNATYIQVCVPDPSGSTTACGANTDIKSTTNTYTNDSTDWLIGRLIDSTVTSVVGSSTITRTTQFGYDTGGSNPSGLLTSQIVEPKDVAPEVQDTLETDYTLDAFGNHYITTQKGCVWIPSTSCANTDPTASRQTMATYSTATPYNGQFPTMITDANGFSETLNYNVDFGTTSNVTDANVQETQWSYDGFGRQTLEIKPDGNQTKVAYTYCTGLPAGESCPTHGEFDVIVTPKSSVATGSVQNGPISVIFYDHLARIIAKDVEGFDAPGSSCTASAPCWIRVETDYNATGQAAQTSRPYFLSGGTAEFTTYAYDALYRVTKATFPDSSKTTYGFSGLVTTVTNDLGQLTTTTKNPQGLVASVKDANSKTATYVYDAFGDLLSVTDSASHSTVNTYDIRGRKLTTSNGDTGLWHYYYDGFGELASQKDAVPNTIQLTYDSVGHLLHRTETGPNTTWTYGTNPTACNVEQLTNAALSSTTYNRAITYDSLCRVSTVTLTPGSSGAFAYTLTYNTDGRIATVTYPSGFIAKYVYTANGYLYEIEDASLGTVYVALNARSAEMQWTSLTMQGNATTSRTFNAQTGRLTEADTPVSGPNIDLKYSWDTIGNLISRSDSSESSSTEHFCYDPLNRLTNYALGASCTASGTTTVGYDDIGNITSKSDVGTGSGHGVYTYGAGSAGAHAVTSIAGTNVWPGESNPTISYTADGNMNCVYTGSGCTGGNIFRNYDYTSYGMVSSLVQNSSTIGNATLTYAYDDARARFQQVQTIGSGTQTTLYFNFGGLMSEQVTDGSTITTNDYFIVDGDIVGQHILTNGAASNNYFVNDNLGSVAAVLGGGGGVLNQQSYDAWGLRRNLDGTPATTACSASLAPTQTTRGYTNQEMIDSVCQVNLNARLYDPVIARMPQADTVIPDVYDMQSYNRYSYVENGPLSAVDPTGHDSVNYAQDLPQGQLTNDPLGFEGQFQASVGVPIQLDKPAQGMTTSGQSGAGAAVTNGNSGIASNTSNLSNAADKPVQSGSGQSGGLQTGLSFFVGYYVASEVAQGFGNDDKTVGDQVKSASGSDQSNSNGPVETVTVTHQRDTNSGQTLVQMNFREVEYEGVGTGFYHGYILVTDKRTGAQWISQGGPSKEKFLCCVLVTTPVGVIPVPIPEDQSWTDSYGPASTGYNETPITVAQFSTDLAASVVVSQLRSFSTQFNQQNLPYLFPSPNSNTYAGGAWQNLTGSVPALPSNVNAPGWPH